MLRRRGLFAAVLLALTLSPVVARAKAGATCTDRSSEAHDLVLPSVDGQEVTGKFAFPSTSPHGLVVIFHGYGHTADDWVPLLDELAEEDSVVTVAMNYHGEDKTTHTWQVEEGADDSIAAAHHLMQMCGRFDTVVAYGVSMGGNSSGLAVAKTSGLFDWWFDIEGANNVIETYNEARALAPSGNATAVSAVTGIENEMHGTFEAVPDSYAKHTNVARVNDIVASGITGIVMVHAVDDGLVPHDQSREMQAAIAGRLPIQFWTVVTAGCPGTPDGRGCDTTLEGYGSSYDGIKMQPLAGHATETNPDARVSWVGFDRLYKLFHDQAAPTSSGDFLYDEDSGQYTQP